MLNSTVAAAGTASYYGQQDQLYIYGVLVTRSNDGTRFLAFGHDGHPIWNKQRAKERATGLAGLKGNDGAEIVRLSAEEHS